jgi:hypothetical protein
VKGAGEDWTSLTATGAALLDGLAIAKIPRRQASPHRGAA